VPVNTLSVGFERRERTEIRRRCHHERRGTIAHRPHETLLHRVEMVESIAERFVLASSCMGFNGPPVLGVSPRLVAEHVAQYRKHGRASVTIRLNQATTSTPPHLSLPPCPSPALHLSHDQTPRHVNSTDREEKAMNIDEKTILITGGNRGIGRALVDEALR